MIHVNKDVCTVEMSPGVYLHPLPVAPEIRPYVAVDRPKVLAFWGRIYQEQAWALSPESQIAIVNGMIKGNAGFMLVVEANERIIGSGGVERYLLTRSCILKRFYLSPELRGRGLSISLHHEILTRAVEEGYRRVMLNVRRENQTAMRFYEKMGYRQYEPASYTGWGNVQEAHPERFYFYEKTLYAADRPLSLFNAS